MLPKIHITYESLKAEYDTGLVCTSISIEANWACVQRHPPPSWPNIEIKVVEHLIAYKNVNDRIYLSPSPPSGARGFQKLPSLNIIMYKNEKVDLPVGSMLPKIRII